MDSGHVLFAADTLRTGAALTTAAFTLLGVGLLAELAVQLFGNWFVLFGRFRTRLGLWLAVAGTSAYMSMFFLAQAQPIIRSGFFYWAHEQEKTGADWVLPALMWATGASGCVWYVISCLEWWFARNTADHAQEVRGLHPRFFLLERLALAGFLLLCLPGFFVIIRSIWAPLTFSQNVLLRYLYLIEVTIDTLTFGLLNAYQLHVVSTAQTSHQLSSAEQWAYSILVGAIAVPLVIDLVRSARSAAAA